MLPKNTIFLLINNPQSAIQYTKELLEIVSILMHMRQFFLIWCFYKSYAVSSLVITAIIGFINPNIKYALIAKAFLTVFLWYLVNESIDKRKLVFYRNFGINSLSLFTIAYLIDCIFTVGFLLIFKCFT